MELLLQIALFTALAYLAYQDFKEREVSLWLFMLLGSLVLLMGVLENGILEFIKVFVLNLSVLAFQLFLVWGYFSIKNKGRVSIIDTQIGKGDILFFVVIAASFSTLNFILAYVLGLLLVLVFWGLIRLFRTPKHDTIPLAGGLALFLLFCHGVSYFSPESGLFNDIEFLTW